MTSSPKYSDQRQKWLSLFFEKESVLESIWMRLVGY